MDFYHQLDFDAGENRTNPHTILVRIRGSAKPKVVVDPFLDSYGGRLADYAKSPTDKAEFFQVIVWPLASCYDERVPNHDKKRKYLIFSLTIMVFKISKIKQWKPIEMRSQISKLTTEICLTKSYLSPILYQN